ncbi:glucans biosynthesis glucosyltransferase H [Bradyrhizobium sp. SSBR45G]|uniref:glucans biosynthesis glucosyltransferase MdoH n=1 Tax=unclassified Bradyrhizobium TaxID=2631580 RepID=UPI002342BC49|nr:MULTISPECIES: glucans biosynthesis glucosyltransferase MdoH [unclassified Bradyrhizobium]GLH80517.1 glucans biosynthesis glucosyltransferase H [Bradyrhizobium sp. SSBR45G]GLH87912.1 glucans biosynthesis glucosyltransferase H [Bradyrhizobium sp. SSBR45R]
MDAMTAGQPRLIEDAPAVDFLPAEAPLAMEPVSLHQAAPNRRAITSGRRIPFRRALIFAGTAALTLAGCTKMYEVVEVGGVTVLEGMVLVLFSILLAWIAFSFVCALAGVAALLGRRRDTIAIDSDGPLPSLSSRTAMLLPTYNEDPHAVMVRLRAMIESVAETGQSDSFDWFLLSDTTDPDIWIGEEAAFLALRQACGDARVFYRHRADNVARKSGNIADWVQRFGAAYDYMIILDADSLMSGTTVVRLAHAMAHAPQAALIQTLPVIVNGTSLFARLQQFAGRLYGPVIAAGNAWWYGAEGNYWGHNAIIRVSAFAEDAALPELPGRKPFGGHILSHDFIEAALMRRAGWGIYMTVDLDGSYEEVPPTLIDHAARDRRWCQGNLQHLAVLPARGLHWVSRLHLLIGIGAYITAPLWFAFLVLGILISLQANFVRPEYFPKGFALFPSWPAQDPVLAAQVFAATLGLLMIPKLLATVVTLFTPARRRGFGGGVRLCLAVLAETLLAALIAPSMMVFQSVAVVEILLGRDAGWQVQRRSDGGVSRGEIYRKFALPTVCGLAMAASAYAVSLPLLAWMSPVIAGLVLSIPIGLLTGGRTTGAALFTTPEDRTPPPVLIRARTLAAEPQPPRDAALVELRRNAELRRQHLTALPASRRRKPGDIDVELATAKARLADASSLRQAAGFLSRRETLAVLNDRAALERLVALPEA